MKAVKSNLANTAAKFNVGLATLVLSDINDTAGVEGLRGSVEGS